MLAGKMLPQAVVPPFTQAGVWACQPVASKPPSTPLIIAPILPRARPGDLSAATPATAREEVPGTEDLGRASGDKIQPQLVPHGSECNEWNLFVHEAATATDDGLAVSAHVPRKAHTRREIVVIAVEGRFQSEADLNKPRSGVRVKVAELIFAVFEHRAEFVAYSEVHHKPRCDPPVVLQEGCIRLTAEMPRRIASKNLR